MQDVGKLLIYAGIFLLVAGLVFVVAGKSGLPLGRLPGDIVYRGKNSTIYFPLVTCLLLSVILSLIFYVAGRFRH